MEKPWLENRPKHQGTTRTRTIPTTTVTGLFTTLYNVGYCYTWEF
jgi:hypothetical protein